LFVGWLSLDERPRLVSLPKSVRSPKPVPLHPKVKRSMAITTPTRALDTRTVTVGQAARHNAVTASDELKGSV
jgi:hypothetical protein